MRSLYARFLTLLAAAAGIIILVVVLLVTFDILWRNLGSGNFPWIVEVTEYSLPLITFLAAPWLLYRNEHVRLDTLVAALPRRAARACEIVVDVLGIAIAATMFWYGVKVILDSAQLGSIVLKTLVFPEWWLLVPGPACFLLLMIEFSRRLARGLALADSHANTVTAQQ